MNEKPNTMPFRPWPSVKLPVPFVYLSEWRHVGGGVLLRGDSFGRQEPPSDLYLRELMDLDLDSPESIAEFCSLFGTLKHSETHATLTGIRSRLTKKDTLAQSVSDYLDRLKAQEYGAWEYRSRFEPVSALKATLEAEGAHPQFGASAFHADDFRLMARELRDMTRVVLSFSGFPEKLAELESAHSNWEVPGIDEMVWFRDRLNAGLRAFAPMLVNVGESPAGESPEKRGDLWGAICAELFNHMLDEPHVRKCGRDECQRLFTYQRGRARYGQHRSGSKFCTDRCASLAAKKTYRDKKRKERETAGSVSAQRQGSEQR